MEDTCEIPETLQQRINPPARSVIDIPFSHGIFTINSLEANAFSQGDIEFFRELAEVLSEGFQRLEELRDLKQVAEELEYSLRGARCIIWHSQVDEVPGDYIWRLVRTTAELFYSIVKLSPRTGESMVDCWYRHIPPEDRQRMDQDYIDALQKGLAHYNHEFRFIEENGDVHWLYEEVHIEKRSAGSWNFVGVITDITERKQIEKGLRESEERFRSLSESAPVGIFHTDAMGQVLYTNGRWQRITDMSLEDSLGFGWASALHPDDRPRVGPEWEECLREGKGFAGEFRFVTPAGEVRWVYTRTSPIRSGTGEIIGHVGANEDITERKRVEEELKEEKEFSDNLLNAMVDTVFVFEPESGKALRWNPAFNEISGYTDEEIAVMKVPDGWYSKEDVRGAQAAIERIFEEGRGIVELSLISKEGRSIPTEYIASIIQDAEGKPQYLVAVGRDITERKRMEEEIRRGHNLESLGILAGGIAHDFNNVLTGVLGNLALLGVVNI